MSVPLYRSQTTPVEFGCSHRAVESRTDAPPARLWRCDGEDGMAV